MPRNSNAEHERIGNLLRAMRLRAGLSQTELGAAIGVSFQQIQKYEKGANRISCGSLVEIAEALGVEAADFFLSKARKRPSEIQQTIDLLSDKHNLRALIAFSKITSGDLRVACLQLLEAAAGDD